MTGDRGSRAFPPARRLTNFKRAQRVDKESGELRNARVFGLVMGKRRSLADDESPGERPNARTALSDLDCLVQ